MKKTILTLVLSLIAFFANAQYGGTASVWVKNSKGDQRCINVAHYSRYNMESESEARKILQYEIESEMESGEDFSTSISYNIITGGENNISSGSASVRVRDGNGRTRFINVSESWSYNMKNKLEAKIALLDAINYKKSSSEVFDGVVSYNVN